MDFEKNVGLGNEEEVSVRSVMTLYEREKIRVRVDSKLLWNLRLKRECTKDLCCHHLFLQLW